MNESKNKNYLIKALLIIFKEPLYSILAASLTLNLIALYYFIFFQATTFTIFFASNSAFYNWFSIITTLATSVLFGITISLLLWQWQKQKKLSLANTSNSLVASFFGAISTGCPVCGVALAAFLGVGGGLAAFPFQGLEIKAISLGLMAFAFISSAKSVSQEKCLAPVPIKKNIKLALVGIFLLILVFSLPVIADKLDFRVSFQKSSQANLLLNPNNIASDNSSIDSALISQEINPSQGFTINAVYGNMGPNLLKVGAIDFEKMKALYERAGQPLTESQIKILTQGSNEKIKITPENSYFLLNLFWAFGLANKNPILDEGPMVKYGKDRLGNFASTGGWTLGTKPATELYSKYEFALLNNEQQEILEDFAYNSYRPCCSNPTAFPDCNHGMAALGLGELMASQGASADEIFEAFKYFNSFWFPQTYFDIAKYFKAKEGKDWTQVDNRLIASKDYSTPQGWDRVRNWLKNNDLIEETPSSGGGCGV